MNLTLKIWRQRNSNSKGKMKTYKMSNISPDMSFLEMIDVLNSKIISEGKEDPVAFDHDCREGICGMCSMYINGRPHGPDDLVTTCQLHMRKFKDGDTIVIEPFRADAFPVIKDLVVDRSAFDRIQQAGGFVSVNTSGNTQDANSIPIEKLVLETDSPYLAPSPYRGKRNESSYLKIIAEKIADLYGLNLDEVSKITKNNSLNIFGN